MRSVDMGLSASEYHRQTSYRRDSMGGHAADWQNEPDVFKNYPTLENIPLGDVTEWPSENLSDLLSEDRSPDPNVEFDIEQLARVIFLTHALTAKAKYGGAEYYFRSVASAGALYPFELYVGALTVGGLEPGLYHQNVGAQALVRLKSGSILHELSKGLKIEEPPPVLAFFLTAMFFRSAWKYRDRAYRYNLLDTGHMAENLLLALTAVRAPFKFSYDFDDDQLNEFLGLDKSREVCLACVLVWGKNSRQIGLVPPATELMAGLKQAGKCATIETDFPKIREIHSSSSKLPEKVGDAPQMLNNLGLEQQPGRKIAPPVETPHVMNYAAAVFSRRSSRNFVRAELASDRFTTLLKMLCFKEMSLWDREGTWSNAIDVGFLAGNVEGVEPGFYLLDRSRESICLVTSGNFMEKMARVCLDQVWLRNCAVHFMFLSNFKLLEQAWGARGYRYAMLTAGSLGQRLYVGATSMKLGCCGVGAFYDDEAVELLGLDDQSRLLYVVAVGPIKKWSTM